MDTVVFNLSFQSEIKKKYGHQYAEKKYQYHIYRCFRAAAIQSAYHQLSNDNAQKDDVCAYKDDPKPPLSKLLFFRKNEVLFHLVLELKF